jgi:O-antigen ligase
VLILRASHVSLYVLLSLFFGLVLFADFIPSIFGSYADQRLVLSMSMVVLMASGLAWLSFKGVLTASLKHFWPFLLLLLSLALAPLQHKSSPFYIVEPVFYALYFFAFGLLGGILREANLVRESAQVAVLVAAVTCFFYAAMTITVYLFAITDDFSRLEHIIPWGFVNIRYWSHVATWLVPLFPLGLLLAPWRDNRLWQLGLVFTAAVWFWVIFMSSSRGSMVGLIVGFLLVCALFGRVAVPWIKLFVRFALYGLVVWLFLSVLIPSLVFDDLHVRGIKAGSSGRMPLWQEAWEMSLQNFPFGMGPQSWLTHNILTEAYRSSPKFGHPHNMYLMWAGEYGWISIAGLVVLGCFGLKRLLLRASAIRKSQDPEGLWLVAFTGSVTAALVHAGASAVFIAPGSMMTGLVILTVFWALICPQRAKAAPVDTRKGRPRAGYLLVAVFLAAGGFWFLDVLRYQQAMADDLDYYQSELSLGALPRFWFHGNFPRHPSQMP